MILCHCAVVTDGDIIAAVRDGAGSPAQVMLTLGAGQHCGGCVPAVRACARAALCEAAGASTCDQEVLHAAG